MSRTAAGKGVRAFKTVGDRRVGESPPLPRKSVLTSSHKSAKNVLRKSVLFEAGSGKKYCSDKCQNLKGSCVGKTVTVTASRGQTCEDRNDDILPDTPQSASQQHSSCQTPPGIAQQSFDYRRTGLAVNRGETSHLCVHGDLTNNDVWYEVCLKDEQENDLQERHGPACTDSTDQHMSHMALSDKASALAQQNHRSFPLASRASFLARKTLQMFASPRQPFSGSESKPFPQKTSTSHEPTQQSDSVQSSNSSSSVQSADVHWVVPDTPSSATSADARHHAPGTPRVGAKDLPRRTVSSPSPVSSGPKDLVILPFKQTRSERSFQTMTKMGWVLGVKRYDCTSHRMQSSRPRRYSKSSTTIAQPSLTDKAPSTSTVIESVVPDMKTTFTKHPTGTSVRGLSFSDPRTKCSHGKKTDCTCDAKYAAAVAAKLATAKRVDFCQPGPATVVMLATARYLLRGARHVRQRLNQQLLSVLLCGMLDSTSQCHPALERFLKSLQQLR